MSRNRHRYAVYLLLMDGEPWMYCRDKTLDDAMRTARALRGDLPMFPRSPVWIADDRAPAYRRIERSASSARRAG